jgi:hypothetical protein
MWLAQSRDFAPFVLCSPVIREGDDGNVFYIVLSGKFQVFKRTTSTRALKSHDVVTGQFGAVVGAVWGRACDISVSTRLNAC